MQHAAAAQQVVEGSRSVSILLNTRAARSACNNAATSTWKGLTLMPTFTATF